MVLATTLGLRVIAGRYGIGEPARLGLVFVALLALAGTVRADDARTERSACSGRGLRAADGSPAELTDCALEALLRRAALRQHLAGCVERAAAETTRVGGGLRFTLDVHPGGGIAGLHIPRSAFDRTRLPACLKAVLRRRLGGGGKGKPARLEGRLRFEPDAPGRFGFSIWAELMPADRAASPALPGGFARDGRSRLSACYCDGLWLVMGLRPADEGGAERWSEAPPPEAVRDCLALNDEKEPLPGKSWRQRKRARRARRREVTACLSELLEAPDWELRAAAAEELARSRRWRGRGAIQHAVEQGLGAARGGGDRNEGRNGDHNGGKNGGRKGDSGKADTQQQLQAPAGATAGHALVRMLRAQLRLRRGPRPGVLDALAAHPDPRVRLRLLDTVMVRWWFEVPEGLERLVRDPAPAVRGSAQQLGCQREVWPARRAFRADLRHPDPRVRASALVRARACAYWDPESVVAAARREPAAPLALLMLRAVPVHDRRLLLERAGVGLFDPCPLVRYLAAGLLGRLDEVPATLVEQALDRERDPRIRRRLEALAAGRVPRPPVEQIWFQLEDGLDAAGARR